MKSQLLSAAAFFVFAVCALFVLFSAGSTARSIPKIAQIPLENAFVDLTDFDFDTQIAFVRFGQAGEYYHNKLLKPWEIDNHIPDKKSLLKEAVYRTYRVRFIVPDGNYMIYGKAPEYASVIYVNGKPEAYIGEIHENPEDNLYQIATYEIVAHPVDGIIEIVTNSADTIRFDANLYNIHISRYDVAHYLHISIWIQNLIILGFVFACAILFIGFYVFEPHSLANLFCALIALSLGIRMIAADKIVSKMVGEFDYRITFFIENSTLLLIVVLYVLLIHSLFPDSIPKLLVKIVIALNAVGVLALVFLPVHITASFIWVHTAEISIVALISVICIVRHIKRFRVEQIISFFGQALFILIALAELLYIQRIIVIPMHLTPTLTVNDGMRVATLGLLLFIITHMLAMFLYNHRIIENEQKLTFENAELERQNKWKTELFGNISHELKTPLTAISNVSQLARLHTNDKYVQEKLDIAVVEAMRMKLTVGQILDLSRLEDAANKPNFKPVDIKDLITNTASHYFHALNEHNNKLDINCPALPKVRADSAQIVKVMVNLIHNASNATKNGRITVKAVYREANAVTITVTDTGRGMSEEQRERIFERFVTYDKSTGTGLGLYICKKIIETHGGEIKAESEPGKGTAISFTLPVWEG